MGAGTLARVDRLGARRARSGRRAADVGALEPRRDAPVTRYGRADTSFSFEAKREGTPTDLERGTRRARAAALLAMALPGSMYVYQGEELGLPEVEDIPHDRRQDPMWHRSGGVDPGRDGCRVPIPWDGRRSRRTASAPTARRRGSTSPSDGPRSPSRPQSAHAASMLTLYRTGLRLRRAAPWGEGALALGSRPLRSVLAFARGERFVCLVNFGPEPVVSSERRRRAHRQR